MYSRIIITFLAEQRGNRLRGRGKAVAIDSDIAETIL
jgi:hypothetical protein